MSKVIAVAGYGPGISHGVARAFGKNGFKVALLARNAAKLEGYVQELRREGIEAAAFPVDLHDLSQLEKTFSAINSTLGPVTVLHWNVYTHVLKPVLEQTPEELTTQYQGLAAFVRAVQLAVPQLEGQAKAAILVTGGGFSQSDIEGVQQFVAMVNANTAASISAAKHNLVANLRHSLQPKGIRVAEVMVTQVVKGTAFDNGPGGLEAGAIAELFWKQYSDDDAALQFCVKI
eukprot:CAMPEP_0202905286 /NCGR_PEP_ID=MMETSP1392-20130828/33433_1 /ASSEMBLY_ACC=CAM_ASM_000868 /TAXON_ID=225041 /ORGANISM="Chlamydomonas chlamydogama, Strain SAG 11-48b" /LENGTH=231 /DNA_ID=CAMNT_0049593311 /DNA_START=97 /DNA_END=792 /DNA_ORIENTATION=-